MQTTASDGEPLSRRISDQLLVAQEIADCEWDMLALEKALIDLKHKRMALNSKMNAVTDLMAILPLEVIAEIFAIIVESHYIMANYCSLPAPLLLGRICRNWRNVAWSIPCLWKNIRLQISRYKYHKQERLLEEWLDRTGTCQLSYDLSFCDDWQPPKSFGTLILKTASRWATFKSISPLTSLCEEIAHYAFPVLSRLELCLSQDTSRELDFYSFKGAALLRHLHISGHVGEFVLPFDRLTTVSFSGVDLELTLMIITILKDIKSLCIEMTQSLSNVTDPQLLGPTNLSHLTHLEFVGRAKLVALLFNVMTVPALSSLKLNFNPMPTRRNALWTAGLKDLHCRSSFNLTKLILMNIGLEEEVTLDLLKPFATLSFLTIDHQGSGLSDLTINRLNPNCNAEFLLPALSYLDYQGKINFKSTTLTNMLEQRLAVSKTNPPISALNTVNIRYSNAQWARTGYHANPNRMQTFYRDITDLASRGTILKVAWDEKEESLDRY